MNPFQCTNEEALKAYENSIKPTYQGFFGIFTIIVKAQDKEEAIKAIKNKWKSYKDGSRKKEHIRKYIEKEFVVEQTYYKNGFWR